MADVIEAGLEGHLSESLFSYVLKVNDALTKTLDAEWNGENLEQETILLSPEPSVKNTAELTSKNYTDTTDLLDLANTKITTQADSVSIILDAQIKPSLDVAPPTAPSQTGKQINNEPVNLLPPNPPNTQSNKGTTESTEDDFDSFFESLKK